MGVERASHAGRGRADHGQVAVSLIAFSWRWPSRPPRQAAGGARCRVFTGSVVPAGVACVDASPVSGLGTGGTGGLGVPTPEGVGFWEDVGDGGAGWCLASLRRSEAARQAFCRARRRLCQASGVVGSLFETSMRKSWMVHSATLMALMRCDVASSRTRGMARVYPRVGDHARAQRRQRGVPRNQPAKWLLSTAFGGDPSGQLSVVPVPAAALVTFSGLGLAALGRRRRV